MGAGQGDVVECCAAEVRAPEVGVGEVDAGEVGSGEDHAAQIDGVEGHVDDADVSEGGAVEVTGEGEEQLSGLLLEVVVVVGMEQSAQGRDVWGAVRHSSSFYRPCVSQTGRAGSIRLMRCQIYQGYKCQC
ncbi:MAG: hypothetical protein ACI8S6_003133 [Myxococcota bacterium]|jgi:hypothetical protein